MICLESDMQCFFEECERGYKVRRSIDGCGLQAELQGVKVRRSFGR